ncbi:MAG: hypothetical protein ABIP94_21380, partial [Planctomycetota bacterium]
MSDAIPPSQHPASHPSGDPPAAAALRPVLAHLLSGQLQRLRRRYLVHGLSLTIGIVTAAILLFFGLDHWLRLPLPIRLLHTIVTVGLLGWACLRFVRYPLTRRFSDIDVAMWVERAFPELHERLVSAVQLQAVPEDRLRNQSRAMIAHLLDETAVAARQLPLDRLFDGRRTRSLLLAATALTTVIVAGCALAPDTAMAFLWRHLGQRADYPRETTLVLELPTAGPDLQRKDSGEVIELTVPAGADLHVSVHAQGTVPKDVFLDVRTRREAGPDKDVEPRSIAMTPRPGDRFRHVFRRVSGTFEFHARGGDDEHGDRLVIVRTIHPAQVASLRATIRPPAYTGIESLVQSGGAIEALIGSAIELSLTTTAAVRQASMVFLESGRRIEFAPTTLEDDSGTATVHRCQFAIEGSDRYQIELLADNGLRNPNPGTYPIAALQDYAPVGRWLLPDDESTLLLPTALLCVRLDVHDDFGLAAVALGVERAGTKTLDRPLLPVSGKPVTQAILTELLEVKDLLGTTAAASNDGLVLQLGLRDNKEPQAGATDLPRRIVQIVDAPQLAAAIAKAFRGLREEIGQALEIQTDRRQRLEELIAKTALPAGELAQLLTGIEVGQGRIASSCERMHRGLMRAFDLHLWNRLETSQHAEKVIELYRQHSQKLQTPLALDPAFYRDLQQARSAGTLGAMETTLDPILTMIALADGLVAKAGPNVLRALAEAQIARNDGDRAPLLQRCLQLQGQIEQTLQQLLLRL